MIVLEKINGKKAKIPVSLPPLWENFGPMSSKFDVIKSLQYIMTWYMNLLTLSCPLQYAKRQTTGWVINWAMWTQHNPQVPLGVIAMKFVFRAFLDLNLSTVHVLLSWYCAHFDESYKRNWIGCDHIWDANRLLITNQEPPELSTFTFFLSPAGNIYLFIFYVTGVNYEINSTHQQCMLFWIGIGYRIW